MIRVRLQQGLKQRWHTANSFGGAIEAADFHDYIRGEMFFRALSNYIKIAADGLPDSGLPHQVMQDGIKNFALQRAMDRDQAFIILAGLFLHYLTVQLKAQRSSIAGFLFFIEQKMHAASQQIAPATQRNKALLQQMVL